MIKVTFEISNNPAQHYHFLALAVAMNNDEHFDVSFFSTSHIVNDNFKHFLISNNVDLPLDESKIDVISPTILDRIKRSTVLVFKRLKLNHLIVVAREVYGMVNKKKIVMEEDFFLKNRHYFDSKDIVLTTELKGSEYLLKSQTKLVWLLHGILSNPYVSNKSWLCDLVVSPQKNIDDFLTSIKLEHTPTVFSNLYVKFKSIDMLESAQEAKIFKNDQHVFMYNPHWDSQGELSSWFIDGMAILEFFSRNPHFNLIFAPHINIDKFYGISETLDYHLYDNIHVDIDSMKLMDGTYFNLVDTYIGDVSSQFFEVIGKKDISAIFLNFASVKRDSTLFYWDYGDVCVDMNELEVAIINHSENKPKTINPNIFFDELKVNGLELFMASLYADGK